MTQMQLGYRQYLEDARANRAQEGLKAREAEIKEKEAQTKMKEAETNRFKFWSSEGRGWLGAFESIIHDRRNEQTDILKGIGSILKAL